MLLTRRSQRVFGREELDRSMAHGLVGHWVGGGSGRTWIDQSGYQNDLNFVNTPEWRLGYGEHRDAIRTDGATSYLEAVNYASLEPSTAISYGMWVKVLANGTWSGADTYGDAFLTKGSHSNDPYNSYGLGWAPTTSNIYCNVSGSSTFAYASSVKTFTPPTDWIHVFVTYDGANIRLYINGVLDNSTAETGNLTYGLNLRNTLRVGCWEQSGGRYLRMANAVYDDIRIYNRALTDSEVYALANPTSQVVIPRLRRAITFGRTLYAKAAGGSWSAVGTWSEVSSAGGDSAGPPTSSDVVLLDAGSGNVNIDIAGAARALNCTGFTGTLTHQNVNLALGDSLAAADYVALKLVAGMTYTKSSNTASSMSFISTCQAQQTIATGGKVLGNITFNSATGSWILAEDLLANGGGTTTLTLTAGTLNTGNYNVTAGVLVASGSGVRTLTLGSSTITLSGTSTAWSFGTTTNSTFNCGTSNIILTGAGPVLAAGTQTYYNVEFTGSSNATMSISASTTFNTVTRTGTAATTGVLTLNANLTTNSLVITANSEKNAILVTSNTIGTSRTITAGSVTVTNRVIFRDITGAGAATWTAAGTGATYIGDLGGLSGITATTPAPQTATGTASFTWSTHGWTSRIPLPQDDVSIPNAFVASRVVTIDMPYPGANISFNGCTGSPSLTSSGQGINVNGSLDLTGLSSYSASAWLVFVGRGTHTLTCNGKVIPTSVDFNSIGGSYALNDNLVSTSTVSVSNGTFVDNGQTVSATAFTSSVSTTRTITLTGAYTLTGTGTVFSLTASGLTLTLSAASWTITNTSATTKTFTGGSRTFGALTVTGGAINITGSNTFASLALNNAGVANGLRITAGTTQTITGNITNNGTIGNLCTLQSVTATLAFTLSKASGTVSLDYMSIRDSTASGGATFYAGANSTNVSGNTGWIFTAAPSSSLPPITKIFVQAVNRASRY